MAKAKQLPVYKEAQRLVSVLHETTKKAPRELRYTLVQKLLTEAVEIIVDIESANKSSLGETVTSYLALARPSNSYNLRKNWAIEASQHNVVIMRNLTKARHKS